MSSDGTKLPRLHFPVSFEPISNTFGDEKLTPIANNYGGEEVAHLDC